MADLLDTLRSNGVNDLLPADLADRLSQLGIDNVTTSTTGDVTVIRGTVRPLTDRGLPQLGTLPIEAPGINGGLRAQLAVRRNGSGQVTQWAVDLDLDRLAIAVPGVRPAREVREPARATRLADEPSRRDVRIVGRGVLRIAAAGGAAPEVTLIDALDATTPFGDHGALAALTFEPPSFFIGSSAFGFTVDQVTYDQSTNLSPSPKPPDWRGIALRRATFYLPPGAPVVGDVSVGVEDVFLGDPVGVEGTATLEFGGAAINTPPTLVVEIEGSGGTWTAIATSSLDPSPGLRQDRFNAQLPGARPPAARVRGRLSPAPAGSPTITWRLNGENVAESGFDVLPGDTLEVTIGNTPPIVCTFTGTWSAAATVDLQIGAGRWVNTASVSGGSTALGAAAFAHSTGTGGATYTWKWDQGSPVTDAVFHPQTSQLTVGSHRLTLLEGGRTVRRVRVDVRADTTGPTLVGCAGGVFVADGTVTGVVATVVDVAGTYQLRPWHVEDKFVRGLPAAAVTAGVVAVGENLIAEVTTDRTASGSTEPGPTNGDIEREAHVQFVFDSAELSPKATGWLGATSVGITALHTWAKGLPSGIRFAIVGRCDDLNKRIPLTDTDDTYNRDLAVTRALAARQILLDAGIADSRITYRGEQTPTWSGAVPTGVPTDFTAVSWKARSTTEYMAWLRPYDKDDDKRAHLRRGDIYAYDGSPVPTPSTATPALAPIRLRAIVPGADPTTVSGAVVPASPRGRPQYRVRIEVEWNDPTAPGLGDAVPIRAEALVEWPGTGVRMPDGSTTPVRRPGDPDASAPPVWKLLGRWAHDQSAGSDQFTLALDVTGSPDGIFEVRNRVLAASLGLAPAVVGAAGNPSGGEAALVGALIAALGGAASLLLRDGSRTVVTGLTIDRLERGPAQGETSRTMLTVDYTVELSVNVGGPSFPLRVSTRDGKPMKLRYRGVGVEVDTAAADWWNGIGLVTRDSVPEVVDPGSWQLGPPLDDLLRVTGVRSGAQSSWLEVDLALSLDLGVVKLSNATVRVVFGPSGIDGIELRGLKAAVDIPATLKGEGAIDVSGGTLHAGVALEIVPLKVAALADLVLGDAGFVALTVGVRFPAPLPFANSGLGLYGLLGRFVSNGERAVVRTETDVVKRELDWLEKPPNQKYVARSGQYALGLGAVVGTVADAGFTFHALGMLTVEFPRPAVVFAVIAKVIAEPAPVPVDTATPPSSGLAIIGLVVIDDTAVTIALRGNYRIPGILEVDVPLGAWFPYVQPTRSYLRIGTDNQPSRNGTPVTITFLPGILDVESTAFVLVHGDGISPGLRGNADFVFQGFSIGFGAGWGIDWSAGPIRLSASAEVLAGFGTSPFFLAAGVWVRGELDLVVVSVAARGEITLKTDGSRTDLHGKFCGEVDCFFFSISGCVEINVSATLGSLPDPPSPVVGVDLVARQGHVSAKAVTGGGAAPAAWIDAIPVVHFVHTVENGVSGGQFAVGQPMPGPVWSGSRDVKHAYRITAVRLEPTTGPPLDPPTGTQFDSAWWWPGVRSTTKPPWLSADGTEARELALLSWEPWTGLLPLTEPDGSPGDPGDLIDDICEPVRRPDPACVVGELGLPAGPGRARLPEDPALADPDRAPLQLTLEQPGDRPWTVLLAVAASYGLAVLPPAVVPLDDPVDLTTGPSRASGLRLASLSRGGQELGALGATGRYDQNLGAPTLVLEVCPVPVRIKELEPLEVNLGCITFADLDDEALAKALDQEGALRRSGIVVRDLSGNPLQTISIQQQRGLLLTGAGLRIELEQPVDEVTLRIGYPQSWHAVAYDLNGDQVADETDRDGRPLRLRGTGIAVIEVECEGETALVAVCPEGRDPVGDAADLLTWVPGRDARTAPEVVGVRPDGSEVPWEPKQVGGGRHCRTVVYGSPGDHEYVGFRIASAPGRRVTVVGSCGILWHEQLEVVQADQHRTEIKNAMSLHATGLAGTIRATAEAPTGLFGGVALPVVMVAGPPPRTLLAPSTAYRLTVDWEWQRWERSGNSTPGTPDPGAWQPGTPSVYRFRTAALSLPAAPPAPVELIAENVFDPRSLARYVTGAHPSSPLPHLLDDPVRVTFSIDYLAAMLERYGFEARVEVRATDVDPGAVPPGSHPPDLVSAVTLIAWQGDGVLLPVEKRVSLVSVTSPCVPDTSLGGTAAEVAVDLDPLRAYDLVLVAHPKSGGGQDVVIRRWHFRTSRYRDVRELLTELGLTPGAPSPVAPGDLLLDRQWPTLMATAHADRAFDNTLAALGIDPWPMAAAPRTTTVWVPPSGTRPDWALAGVLLEAPEPIAREGRITVSATVGATPLGVVASTENGTRVLLAPTAGPVVPGADAALVVTLADALTSTTTQAGAQLLGGPRTIRREAS